MLKPVAGRITLGGDDVWQLSPRQSAQRTDMVVHESPSDFEFTVRGRHPVTGALQLAFVPMAAPAA